MFTKTQLDTLGVLWYNTYMDHSVARVDKYMPFSSTYAMAPYSTLERKFPREFSDLDICPGDYITFHNAQGESITYHVLCDGGSIVEHEPPELKTRPENPLKSDFTDDERAKIDLYDTWEAKYRAMAELRKQKESVAMKNKYEQKEYVTKIVARHGLNEEQADLLLFLVCRPEWVERFALELLAANMVAAEGEGLDVSLEALGYTE